MNLINPATIGACFFVLGLVLFMFAAIKKNSYHSIHLPHVKKQVALLKKLAAFSVLIAVVYPAFCFFIYDDQDHFRLSMITGHELPDRIEFYPVVYNDDVEVLHMRKKLCNIMMKQKFSDKDWRCALLDMEDYENTPAKVLLRKIKVNKDTLVLRADLSRNPFTGACKIKISRIESKTGQSLGLWMEGEFRSWFGKID